MALPTCPNCGSLDVIPIAYGYPGPEMMEEMERGEIILGGCCIEQHQPTHECKPCSTRFVAG